MTERVVLAYSSDLDTSVDTTPDAADTLDQSLTKGLDHDGPVADPR